MQVRDIRAEPRHTVNGGNNSPEQNTETVQAALVLFPYLHAHFQGHTGARADPTGRGRETPQTGCLSTAG